MVEETVREHRSPYNRFHMYRHHLIQKMHHRLDKCCYLQTHRRRNTVREYLEVAMVVVEEKARQVAMVVENSHTFAPVRVELCNPCLGRTECALLGRHTTFPESSRPRCHQHNYTVCLVFAPYTVVLRSDNEPVRSDKRKFPQENPMYFRPPKSIANLLVKIRWRLVSTENSLVVAVVLVAAVEWAI